MCLLLLDFRLNWTMMFLKFMMDQIFCHLYLDLIMAHKSPNFYSVAVILYTFCLQQTTAVLIMASRFIMKVSTTIQNVVWSCHSVFLHLSFTILIINNIDVLKKNQSFPWPLKFMIVCIVYILINSTMNFSTLSHIIQGNIKGII